MNCVRKAHRSDPPRKLVAAEPRQPRLPDLCGALRGECERFGLYSRHRFLREDETDDDFARARECKDESEGGVEGVVGKVLRNSHPRAECSDTKREIIVPKSLRDRVPLEINRHK